MSSRIQDCVKKGLITPPSWLPDNIHYETIMGSVAYKCSSDTSDMDIYGFCMPTKEYIFPHLYGYVHGYESFPTFDQYQQHHVIDESALGGKGRSHDFTIFSITRYFALLQDNNPNVLDSLFTSQDCVQCVTQVGQLVRDNRKIFLHKGAYQKFRGYAISQLHKMSSKEREGKRKESYDKFGWDVKFGYHLLRLMDEIEQILIFGDLELGRNNEELKACRRGDMTEQQVRDIFASKEKYLEKVYQESNLPDKPRKAEIKQLLLNCLESHYGNLSNAVVVPDAATNALKEIRKICESYA